MHGLGSAQLRAHPVVVKSVFPGVCQNPPNKSTFDTIEHVLATASDTGGIIGGIYLYRYSSTVQ